MVILGETNLHLKFDKNLNRYWDEQRRIQADPGGDFWFSQKTLIFGETGFAQGAPRSTDEKINFFFICIYFWSLKFHHAEF